MAWSKIIFYLLSLLGLISHVSCQRSVQIKPSTLFKPKTYICQQTTGEVIIDGKDLERNWKEALPLSAFVDITGLPSQNKIPYTEVKMLWDSVYLYVYAKMEEKHIWATFTDRDDPIYMDDAFEVFIDPDGDGHNYYEFEWNAHNTIWDLMMLRPYRLDTRPKALSNYNASIKSAVYIEGTINDPNDVDNYWSIEIAIPWSSIMELESQKTPIDGDIMRINFCRMEWNKTQIDDAYVKTREMNGNLSAPNIWVWTPMTKVNLHIPERWGYIKFSNTISGKKPGKFSLDPDEDLKQAMWNVYWQQIDLKKQEGGYTSDIKAFHLPKVEGCLFSPSIYITPYSFEIRTLSCEKNGHWILNSSGRLFFSNTIYTKDEK